MKIRRKDRGMNLLNPWKGNEGLLYKMRLLLWFIHGCHRKHFRIKTPFTFATDLLVMDSFAKLQIRDLAENWPALTRGLDSESISVLEKALETTLLYRHDEFLLDQKHGLPAELQKRYDCFFQYEQARLADYYHSMRPASPMVRRKRDFFEWEFTKKMNAVGL